MKPQIKKSAYVFVGKFLKDSRQSQQYRLAYIILEQCFLPFKNVFIAAFLRSSYIQSAHVP